MDGPEDDLPPNVTRIGDLIEQQGLKGIDVRKLDPSARSEAMKKVRAQRGRAKGRRETIPNDEIDDIHRQVIASLAEGKDLGEALAPARKIAAVTLVEQAADKDPRIAQKAALTIVEYTDGKPVQPIKQDGPIQIVFETAALFPGFRPIELPESDVRELDP